jgi:RND family efflux transporter MFP subunit
LYALLYAAIGTGFLFTALAGCNRDSGRLERELDTGESSRTQETGFLVVTSARQIAMGLATQTVGRREVRDSIATTGWLVARPGSEVEIKAPLAGFVAPLDESGRFVLGQQVDEEQELADLHVFLSPQEQAQIVAAKEDADTVIRQSLVSLQIAEDQLDRLKQENEPVRGTRLQDLQEIVARSRAAHDEALEQLPFLPSEPYGDMPQLRTVPIPTPIAGRVVRIDVNPRQLVLPGDPLWSVADWRQLWIRVPVFVADVSRVVHSQPADVSFAGTTSTMQAVPVDFPQPTQPGRQTVDLFYEVANAQGDLRPGQALRVSLPLEESVARLMVPQSAILWGEDGDAVVYVRTGEEEFHRRKVELGPVFGNEFVVTEGLQEGDVVVMDGAEAVYGEEFRWQIPSEEDDE